MKLKRIACLLLGALAIVTQAVAAPVPFLSVDVNGYNAGGGQVIGPTAAGYVGFEAAEGLFLDPSIDWGASGAAGLTNVYGSYTVNIKGVAPNSFRGARNRGANAGALSDLTQDFVFAQRGVDGFGQTYVEVTVSGLTPNQEYLFTGYAREPFNGGADSFQAWSDLGRLGGLDGPGAYMDANFGPGSLYQPAPGGANNPIPTARRSPISGPDSADPLAWAATFATTADASGVVNVYTWADPNTYSGIQGASLLNGFTIGEVPEPASLVLCAFGVVSVVFRRVR
jgi:hypothetical protein